LIPVTRCGGLQAGRLPLTRPAAARISDVLDVQRLSATLGEGQEFGVIRNALNRRATAIVVGKERRYRLQFVVVERSAPRPGQNRITNGIIFGCQSRLKPRCIGSRVGGPCAADYEHCPDGEAVPVFDVLTAATGSGSIQGLNTAARAFTKSSVSRVTTVKP
jgi:hypothetical protein